jgi:hypothetical protein
MTLPMGTSVTGPTCRSSSIQQSSHHQIGGLLSVRVMWPAFLQKVHEVI